MIAAHTGTAWRAAFVGFAPGFAYLTGGDPRLQVPRRSESRTSVPAGSVALAGEFSAVYPRHSPGGWQLIGTTDARCGTSTPTAGGDPARPLGAVRRRRSEPPAPRSSMPPPPDSDPAARTRRIDVSRSLTVLRPGPLALVQDAGRVGHAADGVGRSGAADRPSLALANRLVGNHAGRGRRSSAPSAA